jgi:uncharacterized protein YjbI with pentapeptide repeats
LTESSFRKSTLNGAQFREADLKKAVLIGADCTGANFKMADLRNANLSGATLTNAEFDGTKVHGCVLTGVKFGEGQDETKNLNYRVDISEAADGSQMVGALEWLKTGAGAGQG